MGKPKGLRKTSSGVTRLGKSQTGHGVGLARPVRQRLTGKAIRTQEVNEVAHQKDRISGEYD